MIKPPLLITIDTNIFDACKYDYAEDGNLARLSRYVENGKVRVVLSDVVIAEARSHVRQRAAAIARRMNKLNRDFRKDYSDNFLQALHLEKALVKKNPGEMEKIAEENFDDYLEGLQYSSLKCDTVDLQGIMDDYFNSNPPFEEKERKKSEFPDAIIAAEIRNKFSQLQQCAIVTGDKGLKKSLEDIRGALFFESLHELFNEINTAEEEYQRAISTVQDLSARICEKLRKKILEGDCVDVIGTTYDKDGVVSGYDYYDTEIIDVEDLSFNVHTIDEIYQDNIYATLTCTAKITAHCFYDDYDNSPWDSKSESYYYIDTKMLEELHDARFPAGVRINRETKELELSIFIVQLGSSSLRNRIEIELEDQESDPARGI